MNNEIFGLMIVLSLISDMIAALVVAIRLLTIPKEPFLRAIGLVFLGIFLRGLFHMIAEGYGYTVKPHYTSGYLLAYWTGRACLTVPCWYLAFKILSHHRYQKKEAHP